jgi:hypothetical protein
MKSSHPTVPDGVQLIFQPRSPSSLGHEVLDFLQFARGACLEPAGVVKDKPMSRWINDLCFDVMLPALDRYSQLLTAK